MMHWRKPWICGCVGLLCGVLGWWVLATAHGGTTASAPVVPLQAIPAHRSPDGKSRVQLLFGPAADVTPPAVHVGYLEFDPGARVPAHRHPESDELLVVLTGVGELTVEGRTYPITGPCRIRIRRGQEHAFAVTGPGPVRAIQLYVPAGPERRFLEWPLVREEQP